MLTPVEDKLREWIRADYGIGVVELTPIHEGADVAAEVWKARTTSDGLYAVKWSGGGTDAGPRATEYLAACGVEGVPQPTKTCGGELWSHRDGKRLSLSPWLAGARAAETGLTTEQWMAYGALLARVHSAKPFEGLPQGNPINARMPGLIREIGQRLASSAHLDALEAELAEVWREHRETITGLLQLAAELVPPTGDKVICHADPHLGNVLVGEQLHLIDWDDAVLAPREQDLMFMLGGMGTLGPTTSAQLEAFFAGYGDVALDQHAIAYYRHARVLEDVALWSEQVLTGPDRAESLSILRGVLGPEGLAVRALS